MHSVDTFFLTVRDGAWAISALLAAVAGIIAFWHAIKTKRG